MTHYSRHNVQGRCHVVYSFRVNPQSSTSGILCVWYVLPQGIWNGGRSSSSSSQVSLSNSSSEREGRHRRRRVDQLGIPREAMGECGVQGPFVSHQSTRVTRLLHLNHPAAILKHSDWNKNYPCPKIGSQKLSLVRNLLPQSMIFQTSKPREAFSSIRINCTFAKATLVKYTRVSK